MARESRSRWWLERSLRFPVGRDRPNFRRWPAATGSEGGLRVVDGSRIGGGAGRFGSSQARGVET
jgi:hypothetical protein